jgi:hypothetical protein
VTAADLASPRVTASIEQIEAHAAGPRSHPIPKAILVWCGCRLTECATCSPDLMAAMAHDELLHHSKILFG